ncbi:MAG: chitinase [Actinobacteria bacterium]|nr:chitinase [Actinomycetota bacterium]
MARKPNSFMAVVTVAVLSGAVVGCSKASTVTSGSFKSLPRHVYAPYYETYRAPHGAGIAATERASGGTYFTLAFLQSTGKNSCRLDWNGRAAQPLAYYAADIAALRAAGGDVIPSFGGFSADQGGTEIADSCTSANSIAADYEAVIRTLGATRLDMDVEARSLKNAAGIDRRNEAIALTQRWAKQEGIPLQVQYTLPANQHGLDADGQRVLHNAIRHGAAVASVNLMAFDYYTGGAGAVNMGQAAVNAATGAHAQLASIYRNLSSASLWNMEGLTLLPGIDDNISKTEVTYLTDARTVLAFAQARGLNFLSIWAIQRDNGGCPGTPDSNTCSGIQQDSWLFSQVLEPFTS